MSVLARFNIPFVGMKNKVHLLDFEVDKTFFQSFENAPIENCRVNIKLEFDKRESFFHLKFYVDGTVEKECDRCLELFDQNIFGDYELFVKQSGSVKQEGNHEDVLVINPSDDHLDISKVVYDYILLSIPLQCIHPDDAEGNQGCEIDLNQKNEDDNEVVDPRWAALQNLKNKN